MKRLDQLISLGVPRPVAEAISQQDAPRRAMRVSAKVESGVGTIEIYEQIGFDWWTGEGMTAAKFSELVNSLGDVEKVVLKLNSPGGDVWDGLTIHNTIRMLEVPVDAIIEGIAASAASVIAIAADKVYMHQASQMMIHRAWTMAMGNAGQMREIADILDKVDSQIADLYAAKGGKTKQDYLDAMAAESYLTPQEAIILGLADGTVEPPKRKEKASTGKRLRNEAMLFSLRSRLAT